MADVLIVGEINVDLILQNYEAFPAPGREVLVEDFVITLGSASAIVAVGLAKLGTPVAFVSRVGDDAFGAHCLQAMAAAGIDLSRVDRDPALKTGVTVSISSAADRALVTYPGSIAALTPPDVETLAFDGFEHLHVSSYFLQTGLRPGLPDLFRRARSCGLTTSLDPGFDPAARWDGIVECLPEVDLFFPNEVEIEAISGQSDLAAGLRALQNGRTLTVAKLGARGCAVLDGGVVRRTPTPEVVSVDTTGAGDSFDAGFLDAWLRKAPLSCCLRAGVFCGAMSTRGIGGTTQQASREETEAHLATFGRTREPEEIG